MALRSYMVYIALWYKLFRFLYKTRNVEKLRFYEQQDVLINGLAIFLVVRGVSRRNPRRIYLTRGVCMNE